MTDTIKQFLKADAKRTQGEWHQRFNKGNTQLIIEAESQKKHPQAEVACVDWWTSNEGCPNLKEAEANAYFITLASTIAPAIRIILADIEMARGAFEYCKEKTDLNSVRFVCNEALTALEKYKGV